MDRRMRITAIAFAAALAACAGPTLPYRPEQQPPGGRLSAAYQIVGDRLRVEIDTDGRRLEEVTVSRDDGGEVRPVLIETSTVASRGSPVSVGIGLGGGSWGGRGGVGGGVSVGIPVGGGDRVEGSTIAHFPLDQAGPAPWRLRVKAAGVEAAVIVVGGPPGAAPR